jgi:sigma-B regulation protein RsbU (phosphoserine phosphatase)
MTDIERRLDYDLTTEDLEDLYENAPCGYISIKPDGRIVKTNATFAAWVGFPPEQLLGRRFLDMLNMAGRIFYETHFTPLLRIQGFFHEVALALVTQSGKVIPVLVNAAERRDESGQHLFTRITVFNATDRRRYERELLAARLAAEAAKRDAQELRAMAEASLLDERATAVLREQFIAVLGHDLRNPLTAIMAGAQLLRKTPLNERAKTTIGMIEGGVVRMATLIDNVLDFAHGRLGGGLSLSRDAEVLVEPVLRQVIAEWQTAWPQRIFEVGLDAREPVSCDAGRIGQLFSNLLGNALTYGAPDKPIRIEAHTGGGTFWFSVSNTGEPIPPEVLERLFHPFFRGDVRSNQQGLGLGLYIVSEIARAHGGSICVESAASETRFTFQMPLHAV